MTKYPKLLSAVQVGDLSLPNRVLMAPLTRGRCGPSHTPDALTTEYYTQRASAGLLITEGTQTSLQARGWYGAPDIYTAEHAAAWRQTTDAVHAAGGRIVCQLWHTGRASHSNFRGGTDGPLGAQALSVAPSALARKSQSGEVRYTAVAGAVPLETPRALSTDEVRALPAEFAAAARTAKDAGFDGVEVHCANGYLLDTFLQSCSNARDDAYGGSLENRFRVVDEVVRAVVDVFGAGRVGVRISPNGSYNGMGAEDNRDAFLYFTERFRAHGLAYLHVMIGTGFGFHGFGEPLTMKDIRKAYGGGVLVANVGYDAEMAEKEIAAGDTDLVAFGRPFIANPDLVERLTAGAELVESDPKLWWSEADNELGEKGYTTYEPMAKA